MSIPQIPLVLANNIATKAYVDNALLSGSPPGPPGPPGPAGPQGPNWQTGTGLALNSGTTPNTVYLANTTVPAGTFQGITFNAQGQATAAANQNYVTQSQLGARAVARSATLNPAGTTSTTGVMMGVGLTITPTLSGTVLFLATGAIANTLAAPSTTISGSQVTMSYGTGAAPANGAALTGTAIGNTLANSVYASALSGVSRPFSVLGIVTGLAVGTPYWVDFQLAAIGTGTAIIYNAEIQAIEL